MSAGKRNGVIQMDDNAYMLGYETGVEAGRREVTDWIMSHQDGMMAGQDVQTVAGNDCTYGNTSHLLVRWLELQTKLKEWEIKT